MESKKSKKTKRDMASGDYIRFDWAMKRLLRNKADYTVVEGFLTVLLGEPLRINKILESESNRDEEESKQNRVDLLMENQKGELLIIEVQNEPETAYFKRMLFGTSKLITEYIKKGDKYDQIRKVYSINIVYFNLGYGKDTVYRGTTEFRGIHTGEILTTEPFCVEKPDVQSVSRLFPEYYVLKVNNFNDVAKDPLEEWIYYLKNGDIPESATAPGLPEARERLHIDRMSREERKAYDRHLMNLAILRDQHETAQRGGMEKGLAEGLAKGLAKGRAEGIQIATLNIARTMYAKGIPLETISQVTGLPPEDIQTLE